MSEMGEAFNALRDANREKRAQNTASSTQLLIDKGVKFESVNHGVQLIIKQGDTTYDFWPSTGLYISRTPQRRGRGVFNLLKELGHE